MMLQLFISWLCFLSLLASTSGEITKDDVTFSVSPEVFSDDVARNITVTMTTTYPQVDDVTDTLRIGYYVADTERMIVSRPLSPAQDFYNFTRNIEFFGADGGAVTAPGGTRHVVTAAMSRCQTTTTVIPLTVIHSTSIPIVKHTQLTVQDVSGSLSMSINDASIACGGSITYTDIVPWMDIRCSFSGFFPSPAVSLSKEGANISDADAQLQLTATRNVSTCLFDGYMFAGRVSTGSKHKQTIRCSAVEEYCDVQIVQTPVNFTDGSATFTGIEVYAAEASTERGQLIIPYPKTRVAFEFCMFDDEQISDVVGVETRYQAAEQLYDLRFTVTTDGDLKCYARELTTQLLKLVATKAIEIGLGPKGAPTVTDGQNGTLYCDTSNIEPGKPAQYRYTWIIDDTETVTTLPNLRVYSEGHPRCKVSNDFGFSMWSKDTSEKEATWKLYVYIILAIVLAAVFLVAFLWCWRQRMKEREALKYVLKMRYEQDFTDSMKDKTSEEYKHKSDELTKTLRAFIKNMNISNDFKVMLISMAQGSIEAKYLITIFSVRNRNSREQDVGESIKDSIVEEIRENPDCELRQQRAMAEDVEIEVFEVDSPREVQAARSGDVELGTVEEHELRDNLLNEAQAEERQTYDVIPEGWIHSLMPAAAASPQDVVDHAPTYFTFYNYTDSERPVEELYKEYELSSTNIVTVKDLLTCSLGRTPTVTIIQGESGSGKTALVNKLSSEIAKNQSDVSGLLDFKYLFLIKASSLGQNQSLLSYMHQEYLAKDDNLENSERRLSGVKSLVVIDDYDNLNTEYQTLSELRQEPCLQGACYVITTSSSTMPGGVQPGEYSALYLIPSAKESDWLKQIFSQMQVAPPELRVQSIQDCHNQHDNLILLSKFRNITSLLGTLVETYLWLDIMVGEKCTAECVRGVELLTNIADSESGELTNQLQKLRVHKTCHFPTMQVTTSSLAISACASVVVLHYTKSVCGNYLTSLTICDVTMTPDHWRQVMKALALCKKLDHSSFDNFKIEGNVSSEMLQVEEKLPAIKQLQLTNMLGVLASFLIAQMWTKVVQLTVANLYMNQDNIQHVVKKACSPVGSSFLDVWSFDEKGEVAVGGDVVDGFENPAAADKVTRYVAPSQLALRHLEKDGISRMLTGLSFTSYLDTLSELEVWCQTSVDCNSVTEFVIKCRQLNAFRWRTSQIFKGTSSHVDIERSFSTKPGVFEIAVVDITSMWRRIASECRTLEVLEVQEYKQGERDDDVFLSVVKSLPDDGRKKLRWKEIVMVDKDADTPTPSKVCHRLQKLLPSVQALYRSDGVQKTLYTRHSAVEERKAQKQQRKRTGSGQSR